MVAAERSTKPIIRRTEMEIKNIVDQSVTVTRVQTLHTVGRLLESFGCTRILQLTINGKGADNEQ